MLLTSWLAQIWHIEFSITTLNCIDYISHGAIALSVFLFFFHRWIIFVKKLPSTFFLIIKLCLAGIITETITIFFWLFIAQLSLPVCILPIGFLCTTLLLWSLRFISPLPKKVTTYSLKNAWFFGIVQGIALLPGISRFGSTFVVARWLGFRTEKSFELSFLLGWPINVGAFFLGIYKLSEHKLFDLLNLELLLVMLIGSSVALISFHLVQAIIVKNRLGIFSYYTMALSIIAWLMLCA